MLVFGVYYGELVSGNLLGEIVLKKYVCIVLFVDVDEYVRVVEYYFYLGDCFVFLMLFMDGKMV